MGTLIIVDKLEGLRWERYLLVVKAASLTITLRYSLCELLSLYSKIFIWCVDMSSIHVCMSSSQTFEISINWLIGSD